MQKMLSQLRRCIDEYNMIEENDKIVVGVSGGKDSTVLLRLMAELRRFYPKKYELYAVSLDLGMGMDYTPMIELCKQLDVPYIIKKTDIKQVVFDIRKESNPCSLCAKMRRGALNDVTLELGAKKVALGHHEDDAIETFFLSLFYEGRLNTFMPVTFLDRTGVTQIRPMLYIHEKSIDSFVKRNDLPIITNRCPVDKYTKREEIKQLVYDLSATYPDLKERIFGAMQRFPLPEWEPKGRYKRPKDQE